MTKERHPVANPLLTTQQMLEHLGVSRTTLNRWRDEGLLTPVAREGICNLWQCPRPEEIAAIQEEMLGRWAKGAAKGAKKAIDTGKAREALDKGRATRWGNDAAFREQGLYSKQSLSDVLGVCRKTIGHWIEQGVIQEAACMGKTRLYRLPESRVITRPGHLPLLTCPSEAQERIRKEGLLTLPELAASIGVPQRTCRDWVTTKRIPGPLFRVVGRPVKHYFAPLPKDTAQTVRQQVLSEYPRRRRERLGRGALEHAGAIEHTGAIERQSGDREQVGALCPQPKPEAPKPVSIPRGTIASRAPSLKLPPLAPQVKPTPLSVRQVKPHEPGFVDYDTAIAAGKQDPRFQGPLGFNLLRHATLGFRPAPVNEKPTEGWGYHERHVLGGIGRRWQVLVMRASGEIVR